MLLKPAATATAADELRAAMVTLGLVPPDPKVLLAMTARAVRAYLGAADGLPNRGRARLHPRTLALMGMVVGDVIHMPDTVNPSLWHNSFVAARRQMKAPDARWSRTTLPDGDHVTRLPDGSFKAPYDPRRSHKASLLAAMGVGTLKVWTSAEWQSAGARPRLDPSAKVAARRILEDPRANWRYAVLVGDKIRVKRIS